MSKKLLWSTRSYGDGLTEDHEVHLDALLETMRGLTLDPFKPFIWVDNERTMGFATDHPELSDAVKVVLFVRRRMEKDIWLVDERDLIRISLYLMAWVDDLDPVEWDVHIADNFHGICLAHASELLGIISKALGVDPERPGEFGLCWVTVQCTDWAS